jgi:hypothetical protein
MPSSRWRAAALVTFMGIVHSLPVLFFLQAVEAFRHRWAF